MTNHEPETPATTDTNASPTDVTNASDSPPKRRTKIISGPPVRRVKPHDNFTAGMLFLAAATQYMADKGIVLSKENVDMLRQYYRNWSHNNRIRGKEKASIWRIVHAQILEVKKTT